MIKVVLNTLHICDDSIQVSVPNHNNAQCLNDTAENSSTKVISSELYKKVCKILCNTDMNSNDTIGGTLMQSYSEAYKTFIYNSKILLKALGKDDKYIRQKINDMKSNLVYDKITGNLYDKRYLDTEKI